MERHQSGGEAAAREELVRRYLPLARRLAARFRYTGEPVEDLEQVACLALVKAVGPLRPRARNHALRLRRAHDPRRAQAQPAPRLGAPRAARGAGARARRRARRHASSAATTGASPRPAELAAATGLTSEQVLEALEAAQAFDALSLDVPRADGEDQGGATYAEAVGGLDPNYARAEAGACIGPAFARLSAREREIIRLRFSEDLTQTEIAGRIGLSQMHVSRLIRRAIERMSDEIAGAREAA